MRAKKNLCKFISLLLVFSLIFAFSFNVYATDVTTTEQKAKTNEQAAPAPISLKAKSALLMDSTTGTVLFELNKDEKMEPASITKIMTLLLVMEAMEEGKFTVNDIVRVSPHASSMGGSEIWLAPNEEMSVNDLLKATAISSANDAAVALGEQVAGSHEGFVTMMNERAKALNMKNTTFKNATGLDSDGHLSTAYDIALMSRET